MKLLSLVLILLMGFESQAQRSDISPATKEAGIYCQKKYPGIFTRKRIPSDADGSFQSKCCSMNPYSGEVEASMNYKLNSFHYDVLRNRKEALEDAYGRCLKSRLQRAVLARHQKQNAPKADCGGFAKAREEYCKVFDQKRYPDSVCYSEKGVLPLEKCTNLSDSNIRVSGQRVKAPQVGYPVERVPQPSDLSSQKAQ